MNGIGRAFGVLLLLLLSAGAAQAHHSAAMFDDRNRITLTGTVREFQWTNPHCYLQLLVKGDDGREEEWSLEMGAPPYLYQKGWRRNTVKAGDRITVVVAPLRQMPEKKGGLLVEARRADGTALVQLSGEGK